MRRSTTKQDKVCPSCKKVVASARGHSCNSFFHATEACCGDGLADAFTTAPRRVELHELLPKQGKPRETTYRPAACAAAEVELVEWRRARILTDACASADPRRRRRRAATRCAGTCSSRRPAVHRAGAEASGATGLGDVACPTCMLRATGATVADGQVLDDVSGGLGLPFPLVNEVDGGGLVLTRAASAPTLASRTCARWWESPARARAAYSPTGACASPPRRAPTCRPPTAGHGAAHGLRRRRRSVQSRRLPLLRARHDLRVQRDVLVRPADPNRTVGRGM